MSDEVATQLRALRGLVDKNIKFALLRKPLKWEDSGDIDIVASDLEETEGELFDLGYILFLDQGDCRKYIKFDWSTKEWVHLDVQNKFIFGAIDAPDEYADQLLARAGMFNEGIPCVNPFDEYLLFILHSAIEKGGINPKYAKRIAGFDKLSMNLDSEVYSFLPCPIDDLIKYRDVLIDEEFNESFIKDIRKHFSEFVSTSMPIWERILKRFGRLLEGNQAIVFLGPDGAGKSTITESLSCLKWPSLHRQFMGPARKSEMRDIFINSMQIFSNLREMYSIRNPIGIISRAGWQFVCYFDFIDRLFRHMYFWGSHGVVIFDRYACDMYFRKPTRWNELLFIKLFPKPKKVFLCVGNPQEIHNRKPELTADEIDSTINLYRVKLSKYKIPFTEINTTQYTPEENLKQVVRQLINNNWYRSN